MTSFYLPTMQMLPRWHSWSSLVVLSCPNLPPTNLAFSLIYGLFPNPAVQCGQWILLNNKAENFLCPGKVPLAIRVILISRPQCSEGRSQCAQGTWDISAKKKCFLHFFPPALDSKHDLYGWNSIRSSLRFPSGNLKEVAPAKPMVSAARR